jgi:hypothetical protein
LVYSSFFTQGGYDAAQIRLVESFRAIRFVQVTRQEDHGLKIHYMRRFLTAVNDILRSASFAEIVTIEIVLAYPRDKIVRVPNPANHATWRKTGTTSTIRARHGTTVGSPLTIDYGVIVFDRLGDIL